MPKTTKINTGNQFKIRKIAGGRRIDLQRVKKQTINTIQPKLIFVSDEVKNIIDEINYIITNELPHARTEKEECNILNKISNVYLQYFIKFGIVKTKDELCKKYIEPLAKNILEENKKKRETKYKIL